MTYLHAQKIAPAAPVAAAVAAVFRLSPDKVDVQCTIWMVNSPSMMCWRIQRILLHIEIESMAGAREYSILALKQWQDYEYWTEYKWSNLYI